MPSRKKANFKNSVAIEGVEGSPATEETSRPGTHLQQLLLSRLPQQEAIAVVKDTLNPY